jgi:hypothetical protein
MRDWQATAGGCSFVFRAVYMPWLALSCGLAVVGLVALIVGVVRWRKQNPRVGGPPGPGSAYRGVGLTVIAMAAALAAGGCNTVKLDESFRANVLFQSLFVTCLASVGFGTVMLVLSLILTLMHRAMPTPWRVAGIVAIVASLPTMGLPILQISELGRAYLPVLDFPSAIGFHVGQARHVKPQLFHRTEPGGKIAFEDASWSIDDVVFEATAPGVVERAATARSGLFTVSTKVKAKAHGAEGNPFLPLQVGNEWHYELTTTSKTDGTRYLLIFTGDATTTTKTAGVVMAIEPAPPRDGWREYTLVMKSAQGDTLGQHVVRPIDGETYFYDRPLDPPDEPDPSATDPKSHLQLLLDVDAGSASVRGCKLANVGAGRCQMGGAPEDVLPPPIVEPPPKGNAPKKPQAHSPSKPIQVAARVPTQYALAGPSHLTTRWESHGGASSWIVGILTLGIIIPEGVSGGEEYVLMRTTRGGG